MRDSHPKRKQSLDEFSIIIGVLLAVFAQATYDSFKTYYQTTYPVLGIYFPSEWAGVVTGFLILALYLIRLKSGQLFTVPDGS